MPMDAKMRSHEPQLELVIEASITTASTPSHRDLMIIIKQSISPILTKFHGGYFRISLSLCSQALLWKTIDESLSPPSQEGEEAHTSIRRLLGMMILPSIAFILLWSLALLSLLSLSILYLFKCLFHFEIVKSEFLHHVGVNYSYVPWISCLFLLQSAPFMAQTSLSCQILCWIFVVPILALDVKIYGQWITKGKKRFLSMVANPTSQLSVIGNLVGAQAAAKMGWKECALCMFSLGMTHYLVLFVTLYQRLPGSNSVPVMLRPVFFLFFAAPSMASLAWDSISGTFHNSSKMFFFLSLFLFIALVCRPSLFKKSMRKFNVAWWGYSFPLTVLALASTKYAQEVKCGLAHALMFVLLTISVMVSLVLMAFTALNTNTLFIDNDQSHSFS